MKNKTVVVTGASGNLGQAVVKKFLSEGYNVVAAVPHGDLLPFEITDEKLRKTAVDLMSENEASQFIADVITRYGLIDAVVLTVGGFAMGSIAETSAKDIYKQYQLNFETAYHIAHPAFVHMLQQQTGRIFLIGSKPGLSAADSKGMVAYSLGKSLLFRLAELMNAEAEGTNVVTALVVPGTIDTPQNRKAMPGTNFSAWVLPETIAAVIHQYCTIEAAAIREPVIKIYNNS